ncbi:MAG: hypothetical protein ACTSR2_11020, partial [Candidatus Hodarchaeales archaeon]
MNDKTILQHLIQGDANPMILSLCSGRGICGKCKIHIHGSPEVNPPTEQEKKTLGGLIDQNIRLACQVVPLSDLEITIIDTFSRSLKDLKKIQDAYLNFTLNFPFNPRIIPVSVSLPRGISRNDRIGLNSIKELILDRIKSKYKNINIKAEVLQKIRRLLVAELNYEHKINLILDSEEKIVIDCKKSNQPLLGLVVDLGTTTIVATLINIVTGEILGAESILNPQIKHGRDIMSRLTYALNGKESKKDLHDKVLLGVNDLIEKLCRSENLSPDQIVEFVVVGNTIMHHLFNDLPISSLAKAPYQPYISNYRST